MNLFQFSVFKEKIKMARIKIFFLFYFLFFILISSFSFSSIFSSLKFKYFSNSSPHFLILGPPCSGKGTLCKIIQNKYNLIHISTGDLLNSNSIILKKYLKYIQNGQLIPDKDITQIIKNRLNKFDCQRYGWLLDGYPRTIQQAQLFQNIINSNKKKYHINGVIILNVTDDIILSRGLGRCIDPITGKIYHKINNPPPSNILHRIQIRNDDTKETLQKRIYDYKKQVQAITEFYKDKIYYINASKSSQQVQKDAENIINHIIR